MSYLNILSRSELEATQQDDLVSSLAQALTIPDLPEISQTILNLVGFVLILHTF